MNASNERSAVVRIDESAVHDHRAAVKPHLDDLPTLLAINGTWRPSSTHSTFAVTDPATGDTLADVADGAAADAVAALDAAHAAQADWAARPARQRSDILRAAFDAVLHRSEQFSHLMSAEMGKSLADASAEVTYGAEFLRWYSEEAVRQPGRFAPLPDGSGRMLVGRRPVGPCLAITPWNFPLAMGARKIGPALAAGCTMIVKPASATPLTMLLLAEVFHSVGLPAGVLNVVPSTRSAEISAALLPDPRLRKLTFTGSTPVGAALAEQAAPNLLRVSCELGGNAPFVVCEDADVDAAVDGALVAKFRNSGEACTAANRFYVHDAVAREFTDKFTSAVAALRVGPGLSQGTQIGPLIDANQWRTVAELTGDALTKGAHATVGGLPKQAVGSYFPPTVLADVPLDARILAEETFGPVAPIVTCRDDDELLTRANDTLYGLVSYVYTACTERGMRFAERLQAGMVGLNTGLVSNPAAPFGGLQHSGYGREGGPEGLSEYTDITYLKMP